MRVVLTGSIRRGSLGGVSATADAPETPAETLPPRTLSRSMRIPPHLWLAAQEKVRRERGQRGKPRDMTDLVVRALEKYVRS